jgi:cation-transporting ATPase 13A3/4/5
MFTGWGGFGLLNVAWYMFKTSGEKDFVKADPNAEEIVTGFAPHAFGSVLYYLFILLTMTWPVLFVWIDYEYYVSYAAFFAGSYRQLDLMLIGCWHTAAIWFPFAKFVSPLLGNYYSQRVPLSKCQTVAVWQRADDQILLEDNSRATQLVRNFNKAVQSLTGVPGYTTTNTVCTSSANTRYFDYHCARHSFVAGKGGVEGGSFQSAASTVSSDSAELLSLKSGLDSATASKELERTGENFIRVVVPNVLSAIAEEYTSYFCIYQFMILVVFLYWSYWYMGIVHGGIISLSLGIKVILKRGSKLRVKAMAESRVPCSVLRDGKWAVMDSTRLVPRDVVCVEEGMKVPADMVMISGNCILDEAMLTGEAMPVQKFTIASDGKPYKKMGAGKKYTLFAGTKVLDTQAAPGQTRAIALVVDVGAHTEKGKLVSGILYTPPVSFVFDEHLKVVFGLLACWALVALLIVSNIAGTTGTTTWLYAVFTVSQVFPPILPAVLVIGQSTSAARLRAQSIFCVDLPRITIAGKVRVFCFDKTGTLTQEGLEFNGLLPVEQQQEKGEAPKFAEMMKENLQPLLSAAIGCAHTVSKLGSRFVGNPVDVEMFSKSGWALQPKDDGAVYTKDGQVIKVLKQHEFDHASMSMAVVVQINDQVHIFVKGSFEAIHNLCDAKTLPANYMDEAQGLAANGCYTLGVAHRCLGSIDAAAARAMPRDEVERGNACLALLTFRNNLKPDTAAAIAVLQAGDVRPVMITGDTAMTGIFIARKCNMVPVTATVLLGELRHKNAENAEDIIWTPNDIKWTLVDSVTGTLGREVPIETVMAQLNDTIAITVGDNVDAKTPLVLGSKYELAMTGSVFNVLTTEGNLIKQLLPICRVFARMTPVDKVTCVELHMATDITAMCGDGGNDCGALRAAHVGMCVSVCVCLTYYD